MHYSDTEEIVLHLMKKLRDNNYDVYLNGHEHMMNYAHAPDSIYKEPKVETEAVSIVEKVMNIWTRYEGTCYKNMEYFPNWST